MLAILRLSVRMHDLLPGRRLSFFGNLFALTGGQVVSMAIGLLSFVYLARSLDPESYGAVEYALGLSATFAMLVEGGLSPIGARRIAQDPSCTSSLVSAIPAARLGVALIVIPLVGVMAYWTADDTRGRALILLCISAMFAIPWKQEWLMQGMNKMRHVALANATRMAAFFCILLVFVRDSTDLTMVGVAELIAAGVVTIYYLAVQKLSVGELRFELPSRAGWGLLREGSPVAMSNLIWAFMQYGPLFLVAHSVGGAEVAWFGSAQRIVTALLTFSVLYYFNLYPAIARKLARDSGAWGELMHLSSRVGAWASFGVALCLVVVARPLMTTAFGPEFGSAVAAFSLLVWAFPVRFLSGHARYSLISGGYQQYLFLSDLAGACTLVVAGLLLIPALGALGAASATLLANIVAWVLAHFWACRHVGPLPPARLFVGPGFAAVLCVAVTSLVPAGPGVLLPGALVTYAVIAYLAGGDLIRDVKRLAYSNADEGS